MKLYSFIQKINKIAPTLEELGEANLNYSIRGRWLIDIIDDEFEAYDLPILQLVYCCDVVETFPGFVTYRDVIEVDNYYFFGENPDSGFLYGINPISSQISLVDNRDYSVYQVVAKSDFLFLDALFEYAQLLRNDLLLQEQSSQAEKMIMAEKCARLAGQNGEPEFWVEFIGA